MSEEEADDTPILDIKPAQTKEENYPAWMRDMLSKEKKFTEMLESVKSDIKKVDEGLRELDEKKKQFRQVQRDYKPQKAYKAPEVQGNYHQYYSALKFERNSKLNFTSINPIIAYNFAACTEDPIQTSLIYQRVCQKWRNEFNSLFVWMKLVTLTFGEQIMQQIQQESLKSYGVAIYKQLINTLKFIRNNSQQPNFTKDQIKLCQTGLQLMQRIMCMPYDCQIKQKLFTQFTKLDFKLALDFLIENNNHMIKQEALNLKLTIYGFSGFQYKTIQGLSDLEKLKQILNEELKGEVILPSYFCYELPADDIKITAQINNLDLDVKRLRNVKEFSKFTVLKRNNYPVYVNYCFKKWEVYGNGQDEDGNQFSFNGHIRLDIQNINKKLNVGVDYYGTGELILDSPKNRFHFDVFIVQDLKQKFYIIGIEGTDSLIFEFI